MRLLLDSHVILWLLGEHERIVGGALAVLRDDRTDLRVSAGSLWEIAIKQQLGKLTLPGLAAEWLPSAIEQAGIAPVQITAAHALAAGALPPHHRDPFDRIIIAQALAEGFTVVTRDRHFAPYRVPLLAA